MKTKKLWAMVTMLLVVGLLSGALGCKAPASSPTPAAKPAPATTPAATPKPPASPIVLKFSIWSPPAQVYSASNIWYLDEVEKRTGGRIKFERFFAESLAPQKDHLFAVEKKMADVASAMPSNTPAELPLAQVGALPGIWQDLWPALMAWRDLYKEVPEMGQELAKHNARFLSVAAGTPWSLLSKKPVKSIADLKGLKVRVTGTVASLLKELGAVPVSIQASETYTALERGTVDAAVSAAPALTGYGWHEVAKYHWNVSLGGGLFLILVNVNAWNAIPADLQKIMEDVAKEHPEAYHRIYQVEGEGKALDDMIKAGVTRTEPSAADNAAIAEVASKLLWKSWIDEQEKKGLPAQKVLDKFRELVKKYEPLSPFKKK
ncbi:MAG: C4-dicarboxylate TRAP transporter substrate-binding protein [Chloroflexi bacterium]|nr:C4-dicarboxylate TRAP transporter substrate-binding protein [Chloroflexota bacterium]